MKAKLLPLKGKYYGSIISIQDDTLRKIGDGCDIKIWCSADYVPSDRQRREYYNPDDPNDVKENYVPDGEIACDGHFESEWTYQLCQKIVNAINQED